MAFPLGSDDLNHASRIQWQATTRVTKQLDAKSNNSNQAPEMSPSSYTLGALSGNIGLKLHSVEVFLFINVHAHMCTFQVPTSPESTTKVIMVGRSVGRSLGLPSKTSLYATEGRNSCQVNVKIATFKRHHAFKRVTMMPHASQVHIEETTLATNWLTITQFRIYSGKHISKTKHDSW